MRLSQLIRILWVHRAMSMWIVVSVAGARSGGKLANAKEVYG